MADTELTVRPLRLWFKGHRNYLQAPDLFDGLAEICDIASLPDASDIRFSVYRPMSKILEAVRGRRDERYDFRPGALLELSAGGERIAWAVREKADEPVQERRPYPENLVLAGATVEGDSIVQSDPSPYSLCERVAALNKLLLNSTMPQNKGWWFSRLELKSLPASAPALRLERVAELSRRLVKSSISADGKLLGFVYFTGRTD